jgi:hypothetical protein
MNKTVREASKIGPCAEHSRHPSIEAIDAAENHSGLVEMPASRSNGRKLLLTSVNATAMMHRPAEAKIHQ